MCDKNKQTSHLGVGKSENNSDKSSGTLLNNPYHGLNLRNRESLSLPSLRPRSSSSPHFRDSQATSEINNDNISTMNHSSYACYKKPNEIARIFPEFNGKNISITEFIRECKDAEEFVNPNDKNFFLKIVKSRVTGEARHYLQFKRFDNLEQLFAELKRAYTPRKNLPQLQIELMRVKQRAQEKVAEYALRVTDILQKIKEIIENSNSSNVQGLIVGATETATRCFKLRLRPEITVQMAGKLLTYSENAISTAIEGELFIQQGNDLHGEVSSDNKKRTYCHLAESEPKEEPKGKRFKCFECGNPGHNYRH